MAAVRTAHAQLSQFYLDSTPHGRREQALHGNTKGRGPGVEAIHNKYVRPRKQNSLFLIPARIDFLRPHQQNLLLSQPFVARLWA